MMLVWLVGFDSDAVRIFGEGYRPPEFEAKINQGQNKFNCS